MFDFPTMPPVGTIVTTPDGTSREWDGVKWVAASGSGVAGGIVFSVMPTNAANDAAAATAGVPVNGVYRTGSALMVRVT